MKGVGELSRLTGLIMLIVAGLIVGLGQILLGLYLGESHLGTMNGVETVTQGAIMSFLAVAAIFWYCGKTKGKPWRKTYYK